jgi:molybdenum cofactor synthesis domain-containing protein
MKPTASAAVIIGNEILTAKVEELNGAYLIRRLREKGIPLRWVCIVPDEVDAIVEAVSTARSKADCVFTSGGIGPTHDDITVRGVALALGRQVVRDPELERRVIQHYGGSATPEALRLAEVPEGTELLWRAGIWYPVIRCNGVFLLPGVPQLFRLQLDSVLELMEGAPVHLRSLYLGVGETEVAHVLDQIALAMPHVSIGSYPQFDSSIGYRVKVTVEYSRPEPVNEVVDQLVERLPAGAVLRVE